MLDRPHRVNKLNDMVARHLLWFFELQHLSKLIQFIGYQYCKIKYCSFAMESLYENLYLRTNLPSL